MNTNEEIIQAFANHGLEVEFCDIRSDGLHCTHNGFILSCQWNRFNYCANKSLGFPIEHDCSKPDPICADFEMAVRLDVEPEYPFVKLGSSNDILGFVSWEALDEILVAFKAKEWDEMEGIAFRHKD